VNVPLLADEIAAVPRFQPWARLGHARVGGRHASGAERGHARFRSAVRVRVVSRGARHIAYAGFVGLGPVRWNREHFDLL